jgi:hypothetical protein
VTSAPALARNIGQAESDAVLSALRASGVVLYDTLPDGLTESAPAAALVRQQLQQHREAKGVVLLGGHDIVPSQVLDSLPPEIRSALPGSDDPDEFIVWSDDIYGDREGDRLPEVPVSRIPTASLRIWCSPRLKRGYGRLKTLGHPQRRSTVCRADLRGSDRGAGAAGLAADDVLESGVRPRHDGSTSCCTATTSTGRGSGARGSKTTSRRSI